MTGQPGAFIEKDGHVMPDANDEAMAGRTHEGPATPGEKPRNGKEVKANAQK